MELVETFFSEALSEIDDSVAVESVSEIDFNEALSVFPEIEGLEGIATESVSKIDFNKALGKPIGVLVGYVWDYSREQESTKEDKPLPKGDYREVKMEIVSIGRKWIKGIYPGKTFKYEILKNDISESFEVGETYTFDAAVEDKSTKYGKKIIVTPIDSGTKEKIKEDTNESEVERWLGYVEDYIDKGDGYIYPKGIDKLKELGIKKYPELHERFKNAINKAVKDKESGKIKKLHKTAKQYLGYIDENLHKYWYKKGEEKVMEMIGELDDLKEDTQAYKDGLDSLKAKFEGFEEGKESAKQEKLSSLNEIRGIVDMPAISDSQNTMKRLYNLNKKQGFLMSSEKREFRKAQSNIKAEHEKLKEKGITSKGLQNLLYMNDNRLDRDNPSSVTGEDIADIKKERKVIDEAEEILFEMDARGVDRYRGYTRKEIEESLGL